MSKDSKSNAPEKMKWNENPRDGFYLKSVKGRAKDAKSKALNNKQHGK